MSFPRQSGIVLHPTSLPGAYGIGQIGAEARAFVDALVEMGQTIWQVLPLGPTSYGDSPYQSLSTFAGNHLLLDFDTLMDQDLLLKSELGDYFAFDPVLIDYGAVINHHAPIYDTLCAHFDERASEAMKADLAAFIKKNAFWLDDYALYVALKEAHKGRAWIEWAPEYVVREAAAMTRARTELSKRIRYVHILQFLFDEQWRSLVTYAHERNLQILGDIPIFVAHDSADVWAHPELFFLNEKGHCTVVAGVPPDYFSETGQRWGNPLYRWELMEANGFKWWLSRLERTFEMFDIVRLDHFRGFAAYWEIPADEPTAVNGQWVDAPGKALFEAINKHFENPSIVAEDLGDIDEKVTELLEETGLPGMKVLQFLLGDPENPKPEDYPPNSVCYTGTHDNDTTLGWFAETSAEDRENVLEYLGTDGTAIHEDFIKTALESASNTALAIMQDVLGLDSESRLNLPGRPGGNWRWRFTWDQLTPDIKTRMKRLTIASKRFIA